jgi:hypothetical protein
MAFLAQLSARRFAMKSLPRLLVPLAVLALLAGGVWVYCGWSTPAADEKTALQPEMDEGRRAEKLEARRQLVLWRNQEQIRVAGELAGRRCTLLQAAGWFRALYRDDPILPRALRDAYPSSSDEERVCRWVIAYTLTTVQDQPGAPALGARLNAELREHLERGTLRLGE